MFSLPVSSECFLSLTHTQAREKATREESDITEDSLQQNLMETSSGNGAESSENGMGSPPVAVAGFSDENQLWLKPAKKKSAKEVTKKMKKGKLLGKHSGNNRVSHPPKCERVYTCTCVYTVKMMTYC